MEKTVVRDRADRMGRKGATKRPASSPPHLDKMAGGGKVMGFLEVNLTEIYGIMISLLVSSYSLNDNGPKCN